MTSLRRSDIQFADSPSIDAFGRLRVGSPVLLNEAKRVGGTPDLTMSNLATGSGAANYSINDAATVLSVGAGVGTAVRQNKYRSVYQPGKSLRIFQTFLFAPGESDLRQRVGYFDDNNGFFLQQHGAGNSLSWVKRSSQTGSPVDTVVGQSSWNVDTFDGSGDAGNPSGIELDATAVQIVYLDLEWLAVGRVRVGFVIDGLAFVAHEFLHANVITTVYMPNPNLVLRWEIEALGVLSGTADMLAICGSVDSEGGYDITGVTAGADRLATPLALGGNGFGEILAIRLASSFRDYATAFLSRFSGFAITSGDFLLRVVYNPTETGAGSWSPVNGSVMEVNTTRTVTIDTGTQVAEAYVSASLEAFTETDEPVLKFGTELDGTTDVFSLQVRNLASSGESFLGALTWREIY